MATDQPKENAMIDIRDHLNQALRERMKGIARRAAKAKPEKYVPEKEEDFEPHPWVMDALEAAYKAGAADGGDRAREAVRHAIGAAKW